MKLGFDNSMSNVVGIFVGLIVMLVIIASYYDPSKKYNDEGCLVDSEGVKVVDEKTIYGIDEHGAEVAPIKVTNTCIEKPSYVGLGILALLGGVVSGVTAGGLLNRMANDKSDSE